jgi:hypothetical protein
LTERRESALRSAGSVVVRDALALEVGELADGGLGADQQARAVDEGDQAEVDDFLPRQRPGGGAAFDVDLLLAHRFDAVLQRELHPAQPEALLLELPGEAVGDRAAQLD